jgi:cytochrome c
MNSRTLIGMLLLTMHAATALAAADASAKTGFVALPECSSLPNGWVEFSTLGVRNQSTEGANALTADERKANFRLLFDGKSLQGWHGFQQDRIPSAWQVKDGALSVAKWNEGDPTDNRGDVRTTDIFEDFELRLQWAATPASNSGIFFFAQEGIAEAIYEGAPELQILDDAGHEDGIEASHRAGGLYDLYAPKCNAVRPIGEYNDIRLVVRRGHVEHWLNGYRVLTYQPGNAEWRKHVARSKFRDMPHFGVARRGYIALQDHGDVIRFRNVRIREGSGP